MSADQALTLLAEKQVELLRAREEIARLARALAEMTRLRELAAARAEERAALPPRGAST